MKTYVWKSFQITILDLFSDCSSGDDWRGGWDIDWAGDYHAINQDSNRGSHEYANHGSSLGSYQYANHGSNRGSNQYAVVCVPVSKKG